MGRYRARAAYVEAMRFTGEVDGRFLQWWSRHDPDLSGIHDRGGLLSLFTIHDEWVTAKPGDWVIAEPQLGRFYPCADDVFVRRWELDA